MTTAIGTATVDAKGARSVGNSTARVLWTPPAPRSGFLGSWDRFVGPGATRGEVWLQTGVPVVGALAAVAWAVASGAAWPWWQLLLVALLALDIVGGVVTNSTHTAKRWYHRQGQSAASHMGFVAIHLLQLLWVGLLFRDNDWMFVVQTYIGLLAGSALIVYSSKYLQKTIGSSLFLVALAVELATSSATPGLEWFVPMFFLKLFVSHLPFEAPLAPVTHRNGGI